jgi:hypothetical protein
MGILLMHGCLGSPVGPKKWKRDEGTRSDGRTGMTRSEFIEQLRDPTRFFWATGIEDTFITEPWPATGRTLDEYELTQHYAKWR